MSTIEEKERDRKFIEEQVERYLKQGGKIREIEPGVSNDVIDYWGETNREVDENEVYRGLDQRVGRS
jgi:hypothetical protein